MLVSAQGVGELHCDGCGLAAGLAGMEVGEVSDQEQCEMLYVAFKVFDRDGNGFVGAAELRYVLTTVNEADVSEQELNELLVAADVDGDGRIRFAELAQRGADENSGEGAALPELATVMTLIMEGADGDQDGFVNAAELRQALSALYGMTDGAINDLEVVRQLSRRKC